MIETISITVVGTKQCTVIIGDNHDNLNKNVCVVRELAADGFESLFSSRVEQKNVKILKFKIKTFNNNQVNQV